MKRSFLFCFLAALITVSAMARPGPVGLFQNPDGTVTLSWDANTETDLAGYKVYWGTVSRTYGPAVMIGKVTTYTTPKLANGTWFFAVTAINTGGAESGFSNEVSCAINLPPQPPANLKIITTEVTVFNRRNANIRWTTTIPASTKLTYNRDGFAPWVIEDAILRLEHSVGLSSLQPNKSYSYTASSSANGQTAQADGTFNTK